MSQVCIGFLESSEGVWHTLGAMGTATLQPNAARALHANRTAEMWRPFAQQAQQIADGLPREGCWSVVHNYPRPPESKGQAQS